MTLVQMQPGSTNTGPVQRTVGDAMETAGPRVCDDMTVDVALAVMASARAEHLLVCDEDGLCTSLVTRAGLATVRDSAAYTDQVRLRDLLGDRGPVTSPVTTMTGAQHTMRYRGLDALPVADDRGSASGVRALAC